MVKSLWKVQKATIQLISIVKQVNVLRIFCTVASVEITLYLLADFLLQYVTLFQSRDIVKNLVSL